MNNKLKNFIGDNRKAFDDEMPSDKVWENIEVSFTEKKKQRVVLTPFYKWSMAAAAMLVIAVGIYLINKPAAVVFVGAALIVLAFLLSPRPPKSDEGR